MIMVHKATQLPTPPTFNHRRAPSAPVVVQPTKTPGLLSLSRPQPTSRPSPQKSQLQQRQSKPKSAPKSVAQRSPQLGHAKAQSVDIDASKLQASTPTATPERPARGRQGAKGLKERTRRAPSASSPTRRPTQHQPSPPQSLVTGAEVQKPRRGNRKEPAVNSFDPFLSNSSGDEAAPVINKALPVRSTPKLTPRPSGKLARRRQVPDSPTPAQAIPARAPEQPNRALARSVPLEAPVATGRPAPRRSATVQARGPLFPVCDDTTDTEQDGVSPATPRRSRGVAVPWPQAAAGFDDGPRTAPMKSTLANVGFMAPAGGAFATPSPQSVRRRVPSAGDKVYSVDDDLVFGAMDSPIEDPAQVLWGLLGNMTLPVSPAAAAFKPDLFASSQFQNSPSPEDLPVPAF